MKILSWLTPALIALLACRAEAVSVSGRFTTAAYTFEREAPDSLSAGQFRVYQTGALTLRGLGDPRLSFQTSLRTSLDLLHRAGNDPSTRVQHAHFRWAGERLTLTLGRQFVAAGAGTGTLDGGRVSLRLRDYATVDLYAGGLAPLGRSKVFAGWDDGHMMGVHVVSSKSSRTTVGVSFYRRTRRVTPYLSAAGTGYPDSLWADRVVRNGTFEVRPNALEQQMLGLDARQSFAAWTLYGRLDASAAARLRVRRGEASLRYGGDRVTFSGEYLYRTPWTPANSIFSVFTQRANHEVSWRGDYRLSHLFGLFGEFTHLFFDGRRGRRASAGAAVGNGYVTYSLRRGHGGVSDGIGGDVRQRLTGRAWVSAGAHFSSFRYEDGIGPRSTAFSVTLGLHVRPVKYLSIDLEGQDMAQRLRTPTLLNPFPGLRNDVRLFFRASAWFFSSGSPMPME